MSLLRDLARSDKNEGAIGRHGLLLISLVFLFVALPILRNAPGGRLRFSILLSLVMLAAIYVNSVRRWLLAFGVLVGGGGIVATGIAEATGSVAAASTARVLALGLLSLTTLMILNTLVHDKRVSRDTIVGGICVYLLLGLCFAVGYLLALGMDAGTLLAGGVPIGEAVEDPSALAGRVLYFSFVTLTTLGFGDVTPSGELTQTLTVMEAITGQLYVAIFIARLMALYIAGDRENRESRGSSTGEGEGS